MPVLKVAAPIALRYVAVWWLRWRRDQAMSRAEYLIVWALVLTAARRKRGHQVEATDANDQRRA